MNERYVPIVHQQALSPDPWSDTGKVHEWRNYINGLLRDMWNTFSDEQKIAIAENAERIALQEEWD